MKADMTEEFLQKKNMRGMIIQKPGNNDILKYACERKHYLNGGIKHPQRRGLLSFELCGKSYSRIQIKVGMEAMVLK